MELQHTLCNEITFNGVGLHTGKEVTLTMRPAPADSGYMICRTDLAEPATINAVAELVASTERSTLLKSRTMSVGTVEHALAALYALGVDNCLMEVNGEEFPILDGSAAPYVEAIKRIGLQEQKAEREYFVVKRPFEVKDDESGARILVLPDDTFAIEAHLSYNSPLLDHQFASWSLQDSFETEIAKARSFVFVRDIMKLHKMGLIQGGDISNALIIADTPLSDEERSFFSEHYPQFSLPEKLGALNSNEAFSNEPARHKILDIIGDFALCGRFIKGHVIAFRPGHGINNKMARLLRKDIKMYESLAPEYDPDATPLMDINRIKQLLPHRFPFLMVDKIVSMGYRSIVGVKNVSGNEPFFQGHFPNEPVMPGVLIVEAMAQTGGLLVLNSMGDNCSTYFLTINNVKFRQKVVPGDTLIFKLKMTSELRRGIANMRGLAFVGSKLVCEAEFMAQIINNNKNE